MKIFISWSGSLSKRIALLLHDWLPFVFPSIELWVSERDLDPGVVWVTALARRLEETNFGIVCLTSENLEAPWLLFEAGALAKSFDHSHVVPLVYDVEISSLPSPLRYFQALQLDKEGVQRLVQLINRQLDEGAISETRLTDTFEMWWPRLEKNLDEELTQLLDRQAYRYHAQRFGVGHNQVTFECTIAADGTAEVHRIVEVEAYSEIEVLDSMLLFPEAPPESTVGGLETTRIWSLDSERTVRHQQHKPAEHLLSNDIIFEPKLEVGDTAAYMMEEKANQPAFRLAGVTADESTTPEFFGWVIHRPTRTLKLKVIFPEGHRPASPRSEVRRARTSGFPTNPIEHTELARIGNPIVEVGEDGRYELAILIKYPVHGFVYQLVWQPARSA